MKLFRTDLICGVCGYVQSIQRMKSRKHKELHIKDLYCPMCKETTKFIELIDRDFYYNKLIWKTELSELESHVLNLLQNQRNEKVKKEITKQI